MRFHALIAAGLFGFSAAAVAAEPPRLRDLRTQTVNDITYFQARFDRPADFVQPDWTNWEVRASAALANVPRLVPQDPQTRDVAVVNELFRLVLREAGRRPAPEPPQGLTFCGRCIGTGRAKLVLFYARAPKDQSGSPEPVESAVEVDFSQARPARIPIGGFQRAPDRSPDADDLQGWWAVARAERLAVLGAMCPDFSFYGFARAAVNRTHHVGSSAIDLGMFGPGPGRRHYQRLYELTTGATALTESLQLERMLGQRRKEGPRDLDIARVVGIDIAEHNWKQMMGDKTPDPEPLATLVPHDNYYLHFKRFAKFVELTDFLDQWGTTAVRAYEVQSTDYRLKERYEKQLCLRTSLLGRTLGPLVIKEMAITGNDPYFREGTDVAVIFQVVNADVFRAGVEPYLRDARAEFGDRLSEGRERHDDVWVETFTTPQREVSLYRAAFGEYVVYANSPAGMRRILDARAGRVKPLADALDYRYMRTVFRLSDEAEDGFLFLSDPFIRQLVGPAAKIKEKRRLEGLTGLTMATNAALWHAWQTGKLPANVDAALATAGLTAPDLATPDQPTVTWDAGRQLALGGRYNTLHFATPLVELPIDRISREEQEDYNQFRQQYLGLWRQYFDPVGMRFHVRGGEVGVETFILPLIRSMGYNELRRTTGGGTIPADVSPPTTKTVAQVVTHISPEQRADVERMVNPVANRQGLNLGWLGDWAVIRFDDSSMYTRYAALMNRGPGSIDNDWIETVFRTPVTLGVQVRNPLVFAGVLTGVRTALLNALPGAVTWEAMDPEYRGVKLVRIQATRQGLGMILRTEEKKGPFLPAVYYALAEGVWYASLQEQPIKDMIDRSEARKKQPADAKAEARPINSGVYLAPAAAAATRDYIRAHVEKETHRRALLNNPVWYAFQRAGLLNGKSDESARQAVLYHYLGYVPVSPDGAAYIYDPRADEVTNVRHGSPRRPTPRPALDVNSPLGRLLETTLDITADLRFREDGVHTSVTIRRKQ